MVIPVTSGLAVLVLGADRGPQVGQFAVQCPDGANDWGDAIGRGMKLATGKLCRYWVLGSKLARCRCGRVGVVFGWVVTVGGLSWWCGSVGGGQTVLVAVWGGSWRQGGEPRRMMDGQGRVPPPVGKGGIDWRPAGFLSLTVYSMGLRSNNLFTFF